MEQTRFACKEPGCEDSVAYEPMPVSGAARIVAPSGEAHRERHEELAVYLHCPQGHVHRYLVTPPAGRA